jgi:IS30 family transposase
MSNYKQLSQAQRYQIEILKKVGKNQKEIAKLLGVSESTISGELRRNQGKKGYRPKQAQIKADNRRKQAAKALKMTPALILLIEARILLDWSLEQVSGQLDDELGILSSHERIYQPIWTDKCHGGILYTHLRQCHKQREKKYGAKDKRGQIRNRVSIDERPAIVAEKTRIATGRLTP